MNEVAQNYYANPSSIHSFGVEAKEILERSRKYIGDYLGVLADQIIFTSGGTESSTIFHHGVLSKADKKVKVLTTDQEHPATSRVLEYYSKRGIEVVVLDSNKDGTLSIESLKENMDRDVVLVSLIHVNNQLGTINDIQTISEVIKEISPDTLIYVDGVQALGKLPVDLGMLGIDGYGMSAHKFHGPRGVGALYLKDKNILDPIILGGDQEMGYRSGTENLPGIAGFAKALEYTDIREQEYIRDLRKYTVDEIEKNIDRVTINTPIDRSVPGILNVSFVGTIGEIIVRFLEVDNIFISTTSACNSNHRSKSNLEKLGHSTELSQGSIRICLSKDITEEDIDRFVAKLSTAVENIRKNTRG